MHFEENGHSWEVIANDFVLEQSNKRIRWFLETMQKAKLQTERKMRQDLDHKILTMRFDKLIAALGKDFVLKIRSYIKRYQQKDDELDFNISDVGSIGVLTTRES